MSKITMYLIKALKKIIKKKPVLFTTPGHSQGNAISPDIKNLMGKRAFQMDFSEISGLDNLQKPSGTLLKSQNRASEIYGSKHSYYLVNGSSSGIAALMMATVNPGDKVLVARNVHKSVTDALVLSGAFPVWINTQWIEEWNIPGKLDVSEVKQCLDNNPDIKSLWLTNPTYEGIITDIKPIAEVCQKKGVTLIVDEAHGALWPFHKSFPYHAIQNGADASVQSLHKTASCLTQGAIMHLDKMSRIDPVKLQQCLNIINTSSPSYLLLASIEGGIEYLSSNAGQNRLNEFFDDLNEFYDELSNYPVSFLKNFYQDKLDKTKIMVGINGITGYDLSDILQKKYNIEIEMDNNKGVLALTGIGTNKRKLNKLKNALIKISKKHRKYREESFIETPLPLPEVVFSPREAFYKEAKTVNIKDSIGSVSKETIFSYPPGIPVLTAGELIKPDHLNFLKNHEKIDIIPY